MTDYTLRILFVMVGIWLSELFIKPIAAKYPAVDLIINLLLLVLVLYFVITQFMQIRGKIKSLEPEQRRYYIRRNGILILFLVLLAGLASWQIFR